MSMNKIIEHIKNDPILKIITEHANNAAIYLVGGAVRDFYFDKTNFDKDIIVSGVNAKDFAHNLAALLDATFVSLDEENKIYRLVMADKQTFVDVANMCGETIQDDLKRRDLTINSIAVNLKTHEILDVTGGFSDLENKIIRHINEQNFLDDPLRLLRIYRFEAQLDFQIDSELENIVSKYLNLIKNPAIERINYELLKLFAGKYSEHALFSMEKTGILELIFPFVKELKLVPPNLHHHLNLFMHSIETIKQVQILYNEASVEVREHLDKIDFGPTSRLSHLKLAAFLHDIGKFSTWTIEEDTGRHRFIKHDDVGAKMSVEILKRMKFSKKQIDYVSKMVKSHIYPSHVVCAPELSEKVQMRFVRKMADNSVDVIILAMADRLSARGIEITDEIVNKNIGGLKSLLDFYITVSKDLKPLPKLLSGEEIMELLNLKPSRELGIIVQSLKEAQISGDVNTKEEAILFISQK